MNQIYYVEDDKCIADGVKKYLSEKGFSVTSISSVAEAKKKIEEQLPGLCLVDWNLPDGTGKELCLWIKDSWPELAVIFITVKGETPEIVKGFQSGADDYIVKPFDLEILYSRICALFRRMGKGYETYLTCGSITVDQKKYRVFSGQEEIVLSSMEFKLLMLLLENKNRTITRQRLLEEIWDTNGNYVNDNTLTVTMKRLREKLKNPVCMKTIRSFGYRMEDE